MDRNNKNPQSVVLWDEMLSHCNKELARTLTIPNSMPSLTPRNYQSALLEQLAATPYVSARKEIEKAVPTLFARKCIACGRQVQAKLEAPGVITHETCCN